MADLHNENSGKVTEGNSLAPESTSQPTPNAELYNEIERDALDQKNIASELSSKYRKALEDEHSVDLVAKNVENVLRDGASLAAHQIVYLAVHSANPNTRLKASTYIVDRVLGPIGKADTIGDKFAELLVSVSKGVD